MKTMPQPPRLARKFLQFISGAANIDDLVGDLDEWFFQNLQSMSPQRAKFNYWKQALSLSASYAIRKRKRDARSGPFSETSGFSMDMLRNYIKVSVRNLYQHKYFSILNAFGLSIGMSISLLLLAMYSFVSTYDNFHLNRENIYTVTAKRTQGAEERDYATAPIALGPKLKAELPGVREVVPIIKGHDAVKTDKENIPMKTYYVGPEFLDVFTFELTEGSRRSLSKPNQFILTESAAQKLFGDEDPMGKTFEMENGVLAEVAGVMKNHPNNTHLSFEMLASLSTLTFAENALSEKWTHEYINGPHQYLYVLLNGGVGREPLEHYLSDLGSEEQLANAAPSKLTFGVQHLEEITMGPDLSHGLGVKWEGSGFILFGLFAALILLPACFNYTNISIARSMRRAKEIGLRKTMGGIKKQIFFQFITETVVITSIAFIGALLIFVFIRSEFQSMLVAGSSLDLSLSWRMILMFVAFAFVTGLLAGLFPALHFSGLNPIDALKSKVNSRGSSMRIRKVLTVFQFALSFGFILTLVVVGRQYRYSLNFDFGFERKNTVVVNLQDVDPQQFKTAFSQSAAVQSISMSSGLPGIHGYTTWIKSSAHDSTSVAQLVVDPSFISNFGLTLLAGKSFPDDLWQRERHIIVNEEFLHHHRIARPTDAIGKLYQIDGKDVEVIGVVKNFHYASLNYPIGKFIFRTDPSQYQYASLQVVSDDAFRMFTDFEDLWKTLPTQKKFSGEYFETELNHAYEMYQSLLKIVGFLGLLAITISLLGMLGMVVYTAETKTKEVGIRKVMGADVKNIIHLLSRDYLKMMVWAVFFAVPTTAFLLHMLLPSIQYYSVTLSVWDVVLSVLILFGLGITTIISQTYKTAMTNPATTLRAD